MSRVPKNECSVVSKLRCQRGLGMISLMAGVALTGMAVAGMSQLLSQSAKIQGLVSSKSQISSQTALLEIYMSNSDNCTKFFRGRLFPVSLKEDRIPNSIDERPIRIKDPNDKRKILAKPGLRLTPKVTMTDVRITDLSPNGKDRYIGTFSVIAQANSGMAFRSSSIALDIITKSEGAKLAKIVECGTSPMKITKPNPPTPPGNNSGRKITLSSCKWYGHTNSGIKEVKDHGGRCGTWYGFYDHCFCPEGKVQNGLDRCRHDQTAMMFCRCCNIS